MATGSFQCLVNSQDPEPWEQPRLALCLSFRLEALRTWCRGEKLTTTTHSQLASQVDSTDGQQREAPGPSWTNSFSRRALPHPTPYCSASAWPLTKDLCTLQRWYALGEARGHGNRMGETQFLGVRTVAKIQIGQAKGREGRSRLALPEE